MNLTTFHTSNQGVMEYKLQYNNTALDKYSILPYHNAKIRNCF